MNYIDAKNELLRLYKINNNENFNEIDYVLSKILNVSVLEVKFKNIENKVFKKAKKIILKHLKSQMPLQKIFKCADFFKRSFYVNNHVLTPRFDSEVLIELALKQKGTKVLDLCSGSGCLGLTLKAENENYHVTLADISKKALKVSKINAKRLNLDVKFVKTNMFENIKQKFDIIVCNPPYIETESVKNLDIEVKNYDPILALDGGEDGLDFYKILYENADKFLNNNGVCLVEIGFNQGHLVNLFKQKYKNVELIKDFNGLDRIIKIEKE